mmetsp:Transcript_135868/g.253872  ORF Transcript_135868/g.253872 Transcript_135868/m.253872 type:complete len:333 (+) Transcript_135868:186-1184(+)
MHPPSICSQGKELCFGGADLAKAFSGCFVHTLPANCSGTTTDGAITSAMATEAASTVDDVFPAEPALMTFREPTNRRNHLLFLSRLVSIAACFMKQRRQCRNFFCLLRCNIGALRSCGVSLARSGSRSSSGAAGHASTADGDGFGPFLAISRCHAVADPLLLSTLPLPLRLLGLLLGFLSLSPLLDTLLFLSNLSHRFLCLKSFALCALAALRAMLLCSTPILLLILSPFLGLCFLFILSPFFGLSLIFFLSPFFGLPFLFFPPSFFGLSLFVLFSPVLLFRALLFHSALLLCTAFLLGTRLSSSPLLITAPLLFTTLLLLGPLDLVYYLLA